MSNIVKWAAVSDEETFAKVRVEFSFGDGSAVQKTVTMADFIRAMSTIEAEQERCLEIGQIPNGFYDGVLIQNKEQSFDVIWWLFICLECQSRLCFRIWHFCLR